MCLGTPDGDPPNLENVWDQYIEKKARGLCIAFCEAKDCDSALYEDEVTNNVIRGCLQIKSNFVSVTGQLDLPCERCPCWDTILTTTISQLSVYDLENGLGRYTYTDFARVVSKQKAHQTCRDIHKATSTSACLRQSEEHLHPSILC